jgi:hypothetical protein
MAASSVGDWFVVFNRGVHCPFLVFFFFGAERRGHLLLARNRRRRLDDR